MDALERLSPAVRVGERVSLRVGDREVIGFVTDADAATLALVDRRGLAHRVARSDVVAARRVGVALGRDPLAAPRSLLDGLAARAGLTGPPGATGPAVLIGTPWVGRISTILQGRTPPAAVPPWGDWAEVDGVPARFEGEWVTLPWASEQACVAAAWWATRMGARSVQVRGYGPLPAALAALGFAEHTGG